MASNGTLHKWSSLPPIMSCLQPCAFCLIGMCTKQLPSARGLAILKFPTELLCFMSATCPCLTAQPGIQPLSLSAQGAQVPGLSPLLQPLYYKPAGFICTVSPWLLVPGLTLAPKYIVLIRRHVVNISGHSIAWCQSQIGPGAYR